MSLASRIAAASPEPKLPNLNEWLRSLTPDDLEAAEAMARDGSWSNARIVEFLKSEGVAVGKDSVAAWRSRCGLSR